MKFLWCEEGRKIRDNGKEMLPLGSAAEFRKV
jgi:hypothetical protein